MNESRAARAIFSILIVLVFYIKPQLEADPRARLSRLPVPLLYEGLEVIKTMQPTEFIPRDAYAFEAMGFSVVGAAIYIGLRALLPFPDAPLSPIQAKRLALARWLRSKGAKIVLAPLVFSGPIVSAADVGDFYPFDSKTREIWQHTWRRIFKWPLAMASPCLSAAVGRHAATTCTCSSVPLPMEEMNGLASSAMQSTPGR